MYETHRFKERLRLFISLFLPILIYQLANYSASFVDTAMTGQYRTLDLAGVYSHQSVESFFYLFDRDCLCANTDSWASSRKGQ